LDFFLSPLPNPTAFLQLQFNAGFNGTQAVVPYADTFGPSPSYGGIGGNGPGNISAIVSGQASAASASPEPASIQLLGSAALLGACWTARRRRKRKRL
jgi:hypothetical protein